MCERVIVDRKVEASQPGLLAGAPATGPLVHADPGPHPRAQRPPKIPNEVHAVAVLASEGIARQMGQTVTKSDIHPEPRSEEHTSELQSHSDLVCRLLLEKKK